MCNDDRPCSGTCKVVGNNHQANSHIADAGRQRRVCRVARVGPPQIQPIAKLAASKRIIPSQPRNRMAASVFVLADQQQDDDRTAARD